MQDALKEIPNWFKNLFNDAMDNAKNIVKSGIDKLKSFFNFDWSLPKSNSLTLIYLVASA